MKDLKTTVIGLAMSAATFAVAYGADLHLAPVVIDICKFVVGGGFALFGFVAKDSAGTSPLEAAVQSERKTDELPNS